MFTAAELLEINQIVIPEKKIVIVTHYNPDGDAIGSSLGLKHYLAQKGIEAEVIVPNDFTKFLKWMPDAKKIIIADYKRKQAGEAHYNAAPTGRTTKILPMAGKLRQPDWTKPGKRRERRAKNKIKGKRRRRCAKESWAYYHSNEPPAFPSF